jgi:hypothetical protein
VDGRCVRQLARWWASAVVGASANDGRGRRRAWASWQARAGAVVSTGSLELLHERARKNEAGTTLAANNVFNEMLSQTLQPNNGRNSYILLALFNQTKNRMTMFCLPNIEWSHPILRIWNRTSPLSLLLNQTLPYIGQWHKVR